MIWKLAKSVLWWAGVMIAGFCCMASVGVIYLLLFILSGA